MKKLKVITVIGTRPEIIRLSRVLVALDRYCDHILVHTGQNYDYELNQVFFNDLGIRRPDFFLNAAEGTVAVANVIANIIAGVDRVLATVLPDALLVLGDTNSCLAVIAAKRRKIPIFHMEAGNRCFDLRVPEEINRRLVDHIADINLTYSSIAREYLLREGLPPDQIIKVGSPMYEVLNYSMPQIIKSDVISRLGLVESGYFLISAHREENIEPDEQFNKLVNLINSLAQNYNCPIVVSTHPRTRKRIDNAGVSFDKRVSLIKPVGFIDYVRLQMNAAIVLSDSGTISEESSILNFPALNLRESHERPEAMQEAAVMMVGLNVDRVKQAIAILTRQPRGCDRVINFVPDYDVLNMSEKIVRIIHSYTDYVNRVVWKK